MINDRNKARVNLLRQLEILHGAFDFDAMHHEIGKARRIVDVASSALDVLPVDCAARSITHEVFTDAVSTAQLAKIAVKAFEE